MGIYTAVQRALLLLLAMGNWANTPTPPNDPDAPDAVGNEGVLELESLRRSYAVHEARLEGGRLTVLGEEVGGTPQFRLTALADDSEEALASGALRELPFIVEEGLWQHPDGPLTAASGTVKFIFVTGRGPWEVDAELEIFDDSGRSHRGQLRAKIAGSVQS